MVIFVKLFKQILSLCFARHATGNSQSGRCLKNYIVFIAFTDLPAATRYMQSQSFTTVFFPHPTSASLLVAIYFCFFFTTACKYFTHFRRARIWPECIFALDAWRSPHSMQNALERRVTILRELWRYYRALFACECAIFYLRKRIKISCWNRIRNSLCVPLYLMKCNLLLITTHK